MFDGLALFGVFLVCIACYMLFVAYQHAKEAGSDAEARRAAEWEKVKADAIRTYQAAKRFAIRALEVGKRVTVAAVGIAKESIAEHLPLLRSRTVTGAFVQKVLTILPFAVPSITENKIVSVLCIVGAVAMFARIVHGRMNARGPLVTPRDREGLGMGPGAQQEHAEASAPRTFGEVGLQGPEPVGPRAFPV